MSILWKDFKDAARLRIFPSGLSSNLFLASEKSFVDAIVDLQLLVPCLAQDNTQLVQHCETLFNCGITAFDAPRGNILKLSVIDKINQTTGKEDATQPDDYCQSIDYVQVDPCHINKYLSTASRGGCCGLGAFFGLYGGSKTRFPPPSDAGFAGLAPLTLGFHYAQSSTDAKCRARQGVWAIERGKIYVAPWIQSTETIILKWDGIKRLWNDNDQLDDDPLLAKAIENYVLAEHADKWDHDEAAAQSFMGKYLEARSMLWMQCEDENRVRECEPSKARSSVASLSSLFYNDTAQSFTANCPDGTTGSTASATIAVGTVASSVSVADANQKAYQQAQEQAEATLNCTDVSATFQNDTKSFTAICIGETGAPAPTGGSKTVTIQAGSVTAATKELANSLALAQATAEAQAGLACVWHNAPQTYLAVCESDASKNRSVTIASGQAQFDSTVSQQDADNKALTEATNQAKIALAASGCVGVTVFKSTATQISASRFCSYTTRPGGPGTLPVFHNITIMATVTIANNAFTSNVSLAEANATRDIQGQMLANARALQICQALTNGTTPPANVFQYP